MNRNRMNDSKKNSRKRVKRKELSDGILARPNAYSSIPKTVTQIMPDRLLTRLTYKGFATFTIAAAGQTFARRWTPTSAYDVDPLLGSTTTVGYTELSAFYGSYRVNQSRMIARYANQSTTPLQCVCVPLNVDPGASPSVGVVQSWENNPYGKVKLLPASGGPSVSMSTTMSTEKIYGSKMVYFDDNFAANVNTTPNNNWYWALGIISTAPVGSATSAVVEVDISLDIEFYNRKALLN